MKQKFLIAVLAVWLSACGNPVTNGSGTEQGSMGTVDSAISWTKKLVRSWTAKANLTIPAQGAIADALLDSKFAGGRIDGGMVRGASPWLVSMGDFKTVYTSKIGPSVNGMAKENEGKEAPWLVPVAVVTQAYRGWQISMMDMSAFGDPEASPKEKEFYLGYQEAAAEYTNTLFTQIATELNNDIGVLEDPETAKREIQRIYKSIPKATLAKVWVDAVNHASERGGRIADLSGTKGVDWSADGSSYSGNADGLTWTKSGVAWFGQGALSGKQWTIGLESSIGKAADQSSSGSEGVSGSTGEKSSTGAQPK